LHSVKSVSAVSKAAVTVRRIRLLPLTFSRGRGFRPTYFLALLYCTSETIVLISVINSIKIETTWLAQIAHEEAFSLFFSYSAVYAHASNPVTHYVSEIQ